MRPLSLCLLLLPVPLLAAESSRWRVHAGVSWVSGLEVGCAVPAPADPSTAPLTDRDYDDGFNRVDSTNNLGDGSGGPLASRTGYFAFDRDDQVDLAAGTLTLNSLSAATDDGGTPRDAGDTYGVTIGLRYDMSPDADRWHWGFSTDLDWHASDSTTTVYDEAAQARRLSDSYQLGGVVPQRAPYTGHYTPQPGDQRIGDTPTRSITTVDATRTGVQTTEHQLTVGRIGLWCDRRLGDHVTLSLEGGLAGGWIEADVALADTLATDSGIATDRMFESSGEVNPWGWYAGLRLHVALSERWGMSGACSLVDLGGSSDGPVTIDAGSLTLANLQLAWRF